MNSFFNRLFLADFWKGMLLTFRTQNPKLYGAFLAGLKDATDFINADKKRAAEIYADLTKASPDNPRLSE